MAALVTALVHGHVTRSNLHDLRERSLNTLRLTEATLRGQLLRFDRLPGLLADERTIRALLLRPGDPGLADQANRYLKDTATRLGASDLYLMTRDGETIAASNYDQPQSFVGGNFAFRPYFRDALTQGEGRFFALGTTSNKRGYYVGAPVVVYDRAAGLRALGVLVIKVDLDDIERAWAGNDPRIIVTDPEGIVFMSNRPDWLYRGLGRRSAEDMARSRATRRYADQEVGEIPVIARRHLELGSLEGGRDAGADLIWVATEGGGENEYLAVKTQMPDADWTVMVLSATAAARLDALVFAIAALLAMGVTGTGGMLVWQRRRQLAERLAVQQATQAELERRVTARTAELARTNRALEEEVEERIAAEARLRETQSELIQAGKLAALGQMSAALSHEFNQPLSAARNYAENAGLFLARGELAEVEANLGRIQEMIDRTTRISRHLRDFARKPDQALRPVALAPTIAAVQELLGWRLRQAGAELIVDLDDPDLAVTAGAVRLQQVLVNLLTNALDATADAADRRLHLQARRVAGGRVELRLRDHGPGVPVQLRARIFDPFFSTKEVGKGLGLGLSISYNIVSDFDGVLEVQDHPGGGAEFVVRLHEADREGEGT
ncbi:two-component sensor histidine kinase protein (plasmid) [Tistrella mobilis KA081020-065]|uniref:C4-dicarboxylate transport sensor protein DctB n=1 Tax=Tistrella mobilis (strain KA081020-065) TaxID=1110502 RepID=I3TS17_TISMK|nr:two-component sensor histidine kinase protein [Tistrella mobilis KA081020-065]